MSNVQYGNVGNLGDILKHAALVQLAGLLRERNPADPINYLETHAFVPQAPIKNPPQWNADVDRLMAQHPAYQAYREIEKPLVDRGQYLCSTGLAMKVLENPRLFLAEKDPDTFQKLKTQLRERGTEPTHLLKAMEGFAHVDMSDEAGPLLALFDPFGMSEPELRAAWEVACRAIAALTKHGADGIVLVFQWTRDEPLALRPPEGYVGPVAQVSKRRYNCSAYSTERMAVESAARLPQVGWQKDAPYRDTSHYPKCKEVTGIPSANSTGGIKSHELDKQPY